MASSFSLPSSTKPPTFTLPPPSSQFSLHPSLSFPSRFTLNQVAKTSSDNTVITKARSTRTEVNKSEFNNVIKCSTQEQKWTHEGLITESLPNGMFRVRLDNQDVILGYVSGKIRSKFIKIVMGDRVKIEVSRYDSSKGRIVYRLRDQDPKEMSGKAKTGFKSGVSKDIV